MNTIQRPATVSPEPLAALAASLRSGSMRLKDYIEKSLDRVDRFEGDVHALLPEPGRRARLLAEAAKLEEGFPDPATRPPLYGVLVGVKDIFAADGFETKAGSELPSSLFAMPQGPVVTALRNAGALVLGKTITTEFAYFAPGPTANPWDTSRTPGGSSSGSAAAVAAGFCSLALGTQTIGSISRPAAFCGIAGWKPSYERTSREGTVPFSPSLDHVGLLAPDSAGLALAAPLIAKDWDSLEYEEAAAQYSKIRPILAIPDGPYLEQTESATLAAFEATISRLRSMGFSIVRIPAFEDIDEINESHRRISAAEMERTHREWYPVHQKIYAQATRDLIEKGANIADNELALDLRLRESLRKTLEDRLEDNGAAYWISPAAIGPAPVGLDSTGSPLMNLPWTNAGLPTLTLPTQWVVDSMPIGIQLASHFGSDEELLALGTVMESLLNVTR
ncbi:MAG: amidase [Spirochaetia bacterium]|nr:amidase [Spirochaetia bacterium]